MWHAAFNVYVPLRCRVPTILSTVKVVKAKRVQLVSMLTVYIPSVNVDIAVPV